MEKDIELLEKICDQITKDMSGVDGDVLTREFKKQHKELITTLKAGYKDAFLKMLGFNNSHAGGYTLDHCNGRNGNSYIGGRFKQEMEALAEEVIMEVFEEHREEIKDNAKQFAREALSGGTRDFSYKFRQRVEAMYLKKVETASKDVLEQMFDSEEGKDLTAKVVTHVCKKVAETL